MSLTTGYGFVIGSGPPLAQDIVSAMTYNPIRKLVRLLSPWRGYESHRPVPEPEPLPWRILFKRGGLKELVAAMRRGDPELKAQWERRCELVWPNKRRWSILAWSILAVSFTLTAVGLVIVYQAEPEDTWVPLFFWLPAGLITGVWLWFEERKAAKTWAAPIDAYTPADRARQ